MHYQFEQLQSSQQKDGFNRGAYAIINTTNFLTNESFDPVTSAHCYQWRQNFGSKPEKQNGPHPPKNDALQPHPLTDALQCHPLTDAHAPHRLTDANKPHSTESDAFSHITMPPNEKNTRQTIVFDWLNFVS